MATREYVLKHDDIDVIQFDINTDYYTVVKLNILNSVFNPVNDSVDIATQNALFNGWLSDRCIPDSREGAKRLKTKYNINDLKQLMISCHGLSLSDHYWIDRSPYTSKWKDVNLYENPYDETVGKILLDKRFKLVKNSFSYGDKSPDITTVGSLPKYWYQNPNDKKSYLYKGGSKFNFQEPFNEYFSHLLLEQIGFSHTPYSLCEIDGRFFSVCPCAADLSTEMVSGIDIIRKYNISKTYDGFVSIGKKKNCIGFEHEVNRMIILDYLIDNTDRHWYNFGILRDTASGAWKGLIPPYDNGFCLWNNDYVDGSLVSESMSFADSNEDCLKYAPLARYLRGVPDMIEFFDKAFEKYENHKRKEELRKGVEEKLSYIRNEFNTSRESISAERGIHPSNKW